MCWGSNLPDLVLGLVVSTVAAKGGREILAEEAEPQAKGRSEELNLRPWTKHP